jgi:hypothetical protein
VPPLPPTDEPPVAGGTAGGSLLEQASAVTIAVAVTQLTRRGVCTWRLFIVVPRALEELDADLLMALGAARLKGIF